MSKPKRKRKPKVLHVEPVVQIAAPEPTLTDADLDRIRATDGADIDLGPLDSSDRLWLIGVTVACLVLGTVIWKVWRAFH